MPDRSAVIFDLDGTLTKPYLDFDAIRAEIGVHGPILEAIAVLTGTARTRAEAILHRHERDAAENAVLHDGASNVVAGCRRRGHPVGILTRNTRATVDRVLQTHRITVDAIHTREDGAVKPSPDGVLALCQRLSAPPGRSWMVGDFLFDIQAGRLAGTKTVLMIGVEEPPIYADQADYVIRRLEELFAILDESF